MVHTNGEYRRLGDRIRKNPYNVSSADLEMLQDLRVTFKAPLAIIFKEIERMPKNSGAAISRNYARGKWIAFKVLKRMLKREAFFVD